MPTVPTYNSQVRQENFPGARISADAPIAAFGGGQEARATTDAFERLGAITNKIAEEEKQKADKSNVNAALYESIKRKNQRIYDPKAGALNRQGKDAMGAVGEYNDLYKTDIDEIEKNYLTNDDQRSAYRQSVSQYRLELDGQLQRHAFSEKQKYDLEQTSSGLAVINDDAVNNYQIPGKIAESVESKKNIITQFAKDYGKSDSWVTENLTKETSKIHRDVIIRMMNNDQDILAESYLKNVKSKGEISENDLISIEKVVTEGSLRGESQRTVDKIMSKDPDRLEALELARDVKDPKLRDAVKTRIVDEFQARKAAESEIRDDLYMNAANIMDSNPGRKPRDVIPAGNWSRLTLEQRKALENRGDNPDNDDKAWLDFLDLDPSQMQKMSRPTFETQYWSKFDNSHKTRAEALWKNIQGDGDTAHLSSTLNFNDRVDNTLRTNKLISPTKSKTEFSSREVKLYADFEKAAAREVEEFERMELGGKRKSTGEEKQKLIDGLALKKVFIDKAWSTDPQLPAALVSEEDSTKVYVPLSDIPDSDRRYIENILKSKGKKVTDRKIERAYGARVINNKQMFNSILEE